MTDAADAVFTNAEVHTLADGFDQDDPAEAVAVRDGRVARVGDAYEVDFLVGVDTTVHDLGGRTLLPGFVDAHTHLEVVGRRAVHADLSTAASPDDCVEALRGEAARTDGDRTDAEWVLGFGYDETTWDGGRRPTRADLDAVSEDRPVAAFREGLHVVSLNGAALDRLQFTVADDDVVTEGGDPTGVVREDAVGVVWDAVEPTPEQARDLLAAAQDRATARGVTTVHDVTDRPAFARTCRELDAAGDLDLRVRLLHWREFHEALAEAGLRSDYGTDRVAVGPLKVAADGSIAARTARLTDPYADGEGTGEWVTDPDDLREFVADAAADGFRVAVHAIGDEAAAETTEVLAAADGERHRVEHAELLADDTVARLGDSDLVVSAQPNFLKWAREGGLYETALGPERTRGSNRYRDLLAAGATLAFGSDCMPLDPLFGVAQTVTAPADGQRLSVTEALRAYTRGGAYAGRDEERLGTVEAGKRADFAVLDGSPWAVDPDAVADIGVATTVVDGAIVHDDR